MNRIVLAMCVETGTERCPKTGSNLRDRAQALLDIIKINPFQNPPPDREALHCLMRSLITIVRKRASHDISICANN